MVKIGLIGLGYLGKIHLKLLKELPQFEVAGIYDIDNELCQKLAAEYHTKAFNSVNELIEASDAIDIVTPSVTHFEIATKCIQNKKHIFIEKPSTSTLQESEILRSIIFDLGLIVQVGHVERFNPAFIAIKPFIQNPVFIECTRLALYNPRGTDVSVTLDLTIHDIDLVVDIIKQEVSSLQAKGITQVSPTCDVIQSTIKFKNGSSAYFHTNRNALENVRKITVYQHDAIIEADLLHKTACIRKYSEPLDFSLFSFENKEALFEGKKVINESLKITPTNAIKEELAAFHNSIITATKPVVTIDDAIDVLRVAYRIEEKILHSVIP